MQTLNETSESRFQITNTRGMLLSRAAKTLWQQEIQRKYTRKKSGKLWFNGCILNNTYNQIQTTRATQDRVKIVMMNERQNLKVVRSCPLTWRDQDWNIYGSGDGGGCHKVPVLEIKLLQVNVIRKSYVSSETDFWIEFLTGSLIKELMSLQSARKSLALIFLHEN